MISQWKEEDGLLIDEYYSFDQTIDFEYAKNNDFNNPEQIMMNLDLLTYLPDDIMCKVDRASMYSSLEVRSPFLSKDLIEYSKDMPLEYKIRKGQSKWILKKILEDYLPKASIYRPKQWFGVPISDLINNDLRDWTNDLLSKEIILSDNFFNYSTI